MSGGAIEVFAGYLRQDLSSQPCHLGDLQLWSSVQAQQIRRLLATLHTNKSVQEIFICGLDDSEGASWMADLMCHKTVLTHLTLDVCRCGHTNFKQFLPLLRGQVNLKYL